MMRFFATMLLLAASSIVMAQSSPSGFGADRGFWAGAEFSDFNPDYSCGNSNFPFRCANDLLGLGIAAEYHFGGRLAATGEGRWLPWNGAGGQSESSYLFGPAYKIWSHNEFFISGKFLAGIGHISVPQLSGSYFAYSPGADLTYNSSPRMSLFLDYEYQRWPSFSGEPTVSNSGQVILHNHGLSPNGFSVGAKYRFF